MPRPPFGAADAPAPPAARRPPAAALRRRTAGSTSRRAAAGLLLAGGLALTACSGSSHPSTQSGAQGATQAAAGAGGAGSAAGSGSPSTSPSPPPKPKPLAQLPLGGRTVFPRFRVIAYYGSEGGPALGVLGRGTPEEAAQRLLVAAAPYKAFGRPVQPAMELIATVASAYPGKDGLYSYHIQTSTINSYLAAARRHKMLVVLDVQPGRANMLDQVKALTPYLKQPDVGIALDPEWQLTATQFPLQQIGSTRAAVVNQASSYVEQLVEQYKLPQKIFMVHQFQIRMLPDRALVQPRKDLAMVFHVDGQGPVKEKLGTYGALKLGLPFHMGFKLFYKMDPVLMTPAQAMALLPRPEFISYQ